MDRFQAAELPPTPPSRPNYDKMNNKTEDPFTDSSAEHHHGWITPQARQAPPTPDTTPKRSLRRSMPGPTWSPPFYSPFAESFATAREEQDFDYNAFGFGDLYNVEPHMIDNRFLKRQRTLRRVPGLESLRKKSIEGVPAINSPPPSPPLQPQAELPFFNRLVRKANLPLKGRPASQRASTVAQRPSSMYEPLLQNPVGPDDVELDIHARHLPHVAVMPLTPALTQNMLDSAIDRDPLHSVWSSRTSSFGHPRRHSESALTELRRGGGGSVKKTLKERLDAAVTKIMEGRHARKTERLQYEGDLRESASRDVIAREPAMRPRYIREGGEDTACPYRRI